MSNGTCVITITVTQVNGQWVATANPDPARAYAGDTIEWVVPAAPPGVTVDVITLKSQPNDVPLAGSLTTGKRSSTTKKITGKVKDHGFAPVYKYNIYVDGQLVADPDVQIKER